MYVFLFIFGLAIGSFMNVVALRYDGEHFLFNPKQIGGRSHCPHCKTTLGWLQLLPIVSFLVQRGRCRHCRARIGWQYPAVELLSGIIFVAVPLRFSFVAFFASHGDAFVGLSAFWIMAFEILLLMAYIDVLLGIIPDELNIALFVLAILETLFLANNFGMGNPSFFGPFAMIFGLQGNVWINHVIAGLTGAAFFGGLVAITRGKGMGMGDVKLALPLGMLFGWPDVLMIAVFAFIIGGVFGLVAIASGNKTMKSAVPFAPFLVLASTIAFFFGSAFFDWYFHLVGV